MGEGSRGSGFEPMPHLRRALTGLTSDRARVRGHPGSRVSPWPSSNPRSGVRWTPNMGDGHTEYRERSQATLALVLGILSVLCLPLLGPAAWAVAREEVRGIDSGRRPPSQRRTAVTARALGISRQSLLDKLRRIEMEDSKLKIDD